MIKTISLIVLGLIMTGYCIAGDLSDNFNEREFRCKCCRDLKLDTKLIDALEELRTFLDIPIYVTSG